MDNTGFGIIVTIGVLGFLSLLIGALGSSNEISIQEDDYNDFS